MDKINNQTDLTTFKGLSFDCYGTLIDWQPGLLASFAPILAQLPATHPWQQDPTKAMLRFMDFSDELERSQPTLRYNANLAQSFEQLAADAGITTEAVPDLAATARAFGDDTPGAWPAFADTIAGLRVLGRHYRLAILSNVSRASITQTLAGPLGGAAFDGVYTAEEIGSYKPAVANFEYLFAHARDELGVDKERGELLHVACSVPADLITAQKLGLRSVWISRGQGPYNAGGDVKQLYREGKVGFEWHFDSIGEFAAEVERQFAAKK